MPALLEMAGPELAAELLTALQNDLKEVSCNLRAALDPFDPVKLRKGAHVVVSLAATCGDAGLAEEARALSWSIAQGSCAEHAAAVTRLRYGITALVEVIAGVAKRQAGAPR